MKSDQSIREEPPFTGKHMLLIMAVFFGVIIAVNITMATMAKGTWTGLVVKNSYVASQQFNEHLHKAKLQRELGLHSELTYQDGILNFILKDKDGKRLFVENLIAKIGRPAFEQADHTRNFLPCSATCYKLEIVLSPGNWGITVAGQTNGNKYRRDIRLYVNEQGKGTVE